VGRLALALALIAAGAAMFAASARTGGGVKDGGTFRYGTTGASVQIDPQLGYVATAWWFDYATAAKLFNYPDRNGQAGAVLRPELASRSGVSRDGRTWTFVLRRGFRLSDGSPVTAKRTHVLPPTFPGSVTARSKQPYAPRANMVKARRLAAGHMRSGKVVIGYLGRAGLSEPELLRDELVRLGLQAGERDVQADRALGRRSREKARHALRHRRRPGRLVLRLSRPGIFLGPLLYFTPARGLVTAEPAKLGRLAPDARMRAE
jgi:hypothetical protein